MMKATKTFRAALSVIAAAAMLALFAFAAPQQALAGTLTVPAPKETASIHLGVKDPPASAFLEGWWCSKTDKVRKDVGKLYKDVWISLHSNEYHIPYGKKAADMKMIGDVVIDIAGWEQSYLNKGWPFKSAGLHKSPTKKGLNAPPGGSKIYKFKYCYTADELKMIHNKVVAWIDYIEAQEENILNGKDLQFHGLDGELAGFIVGH